MARPEGLIPRCARHPFGAHYADARASVARLAPRSIRTSDPLVRSEVLETLFS